MTILIQILAAAAGTVAFGGLFGVPGRYYPYCGLIGGAGWAAYALLWEQFHFWSEPAAVFCATVLVILLSRLFAVRERCPVTIFLVSGILPVVGVPLPLISYGGTAMITLSVCFGIIMSVQTHKRELSFK